MAMSSGTIGVPLLTSRPGSPGYAPPAPPKTYRPDAGASLTDPEYQQWQLGQQQQSQASAPKPPTAPVQGLQIGGSTYPMAGSVP